MSETGTKDQGSFDLVVVGGGPGGYVCAIRAAQLGLKTALVERGALGGVCTNWGCIPSKTLLHAAELKRHLEEAATFGITVGEVAIDPARLRAHKDKVVGQLVKGIDLLLRKNGVEVIAGAASLESPRRLRVTAADGRARALETRNVVLATGATPITLPALPLDGELIVSAQEAVDLRRVPRRLAVVGGGFIGIELATVYRALGSEVTVVEMLPAILTACDAEVVKVLERQLRRRGLTVKTRTTVTAASVADGAVTLTLTPEKGAAEELIADQVLVAVGMRPNAEGLGLEALGVARDAKGFVTVDAQRQTNVPGVYAIGDLAGGALLAHKASHEGIVAAEAIAGRRVAFDPRAVPFAVFTDPEIAAVGLTEAEAQAQGRKVRVGRFPLRALGKAQALAETEGLAKVVADAETDALLGVHLVGPHAGDLIAEAALALEVDATAEDLGAVIHVHPTISEALGEAALHADRRALNILNG
jgi:dihydrolipoamide dehydrogenase